MKIDLKGNSGRFKKEQNGGAMVLALVLLTIGSLMLPPLIRLVDTGFKAANVFQEKSYQKYAAGSGIDDGVWQINNGALETLFNSPSYDALTNRSAIGRDRITIFYPDITRKPFIRVFHCQRLRAFCSFRCRFSAFICFRVYCLA